MLELLVSALTALTVSLSQYRTALAIQVAEIKIAPVVETPIQDWRKQEVKDLIIERADFYQVSSSLALFIAEKESNFNEFATNPKSGAAGVFQWVKSSFSALCFGSPYNRWDNVDCALKTLSKPGGLKHWQADPLMALWLKNAGW